MRDMRSPWTLSGIRRAAISAARATDEALRMRSSTPGCCSECMTSSRKSGFPLVFAWMISATSSGRSGTPKAPRTRFEDWARVSSPSAMLVGLPGKSRRPSKRRDTISSNDSQDMLPARCAISARELSSAQCASSITMTWPRPPWGPPWRPSAATSRVTRANNRSRLVRGSSADTTSFTGSRKPKSGFKSGPNSTMSPAIERTRRSTAPVRSRSDIASEMPQTEEIISTHGVKGTACRCS
jgi:hypothetical protein